METTKTENLESKPTVNQMREELVEWLSGPDIEDSQIEALYNAV